MAYDTDSTSSASDPAVVAKAADDGVKGQADDTHLLASRAGSTSSGDKLPFPFPEERDPSQRADVVEFVQKVALRTKEGFQYRRAHYDWLDWLAVFFPCVKWLRSYDIKKFLVADFIAGLSVGFMVIPQGMSYANLAGLPSVYGLYGAFVPVLIYAVFGSSRQLAVGPVAVTSMLIGQNLPKIIRGADLITTPNTPTPEQEPIQAAYNRAAIQLAFLVAVLYTAVGVLRLGYITNFLSHSVIGGFTSGAAITIGLSQLKYVLGISVPRKDSLQEQVELYLDNIRNFRWEEFIMGVCLMLVLVVFREVGKKFKRFSWMRPLGPIAACVISLLTSYIGKVDKHGLRIIASIPKGLPKPTVQWWFPMENFDQLMSLAIVIMLVDLLESTSIARALARKNNYELVPNQEITGLGLANFAGACFCSYTTTGSFSRSAVNNASGAKTGLAGFFTAWTVAFVLLFLTPVFEHLTYNTLGAIVIVAVTGLFEYEQAVYLFRVNKLDWLVWMASFCGTLFINIEIGLAISIGLAVLIVVYESAFPHTAVLGRVSHSSSVYRNIKQYPDAQVLPGILIVRIDAAIYFANVQWIKDQLHKYKANATKYSADAGVPLEYLVLDFSPVPHVDAQGLHALEHLIEEHAEEGIQTALANINAKVIKELGSGGIPSAIGRDWIFVSVADAVECITKSMQERGQALRMVSAAEVLDGVSIARRLRSKKASN